MDIDLSVSVLKLTFGGLSYPEVVPGCEGEGGGFNVSEGEVNLSGPIS